MLDAFEPGADFVAPFSSDKQHATGADNLAASERHARCNRSAEIERNERLASAPLTGHQADSLSRDQFLDQPGMGRPGVRFAMPEEIDIRRRIAGRSRCSLVSEIRVRLQFSAAEA